MSQGDSCVTAIESMDEAVRGVLLPRQSLPQDGIQAALCKCICVVPIHIHKFQFKQNQRGNQKWIDAIEKDLHRNFPTHELFGGVYERIGQSELYRVLKAYSVLNPVDGYCQAMAPIAALLLMNMPAEQAFWDGINSLQLETLITETNVAFISSSDNNRAEDVCDTGAWCPSATSTSPATTPPAWRPSSWTGTSSSGC